MHKKRFGVWWDDVTVFDCELQQRLNVIALFNKETHDWQNSIEESIVNHSLLLKLKKSKSEI